MRSHHLIAAAALTMAGLTAPSFADLISNGNFEAGNAGFSSGYILDSSPGAGLNAGAQQGAGYFGLVSNAQTWHPSFASFGDHTTGSGTMMIVNGTNVADTTVWQQDSVAVSAGDLYEFSFWARSAYPDSPADLHISTNINGTELHATLTSDTSAWVHYSILWTASTSPASIRLVDNNLALQGNDFAIDDISLTRICTTPENPGNPQLVPLPGAAWTGIGGLAGVGALGLARRRKMTSR